MSSGRILGLDVGERRVGVALSDGLGLTAQPYTVLDRTESDVVAEVAAIAAREGVGLVVVGVATTLAGREGESARRGRELGAEIARNTGMPVEFVDERFTTKIAEDALVSGGVRRTERRRLRDKVAAAIILQSYLDAHP